MKTYASGKCILPRAGHYISYLFGAVVRHVGWLFCTGCDELHG